MKFLYLILCLLVGTPTFGYNDYRNARVDSLEAALRSNHPPKGDDLLRAYDELVRGYLPYDAKKTEHYARKALALSYERGALYIRQNMLAHFALMHFGREEFDEAIALYRQALAVVDTMATLKRYTEKEIDDARSSIYGNMANAYNLQDKAHLAIHYYQLALPIFEKYNWLESQTVLYYNIGELYHTMGNLAEAERNYRLAEAKGEASGDSLMMAMPRKGLTQLYIANGQYEQARQMAEKCYAFYYAHRHQEQQEYPVVLAALAQLNLMEGHQDLKAAKAFADKALSLADSLLFDNKSSIYMACCEVAMAEKQWQKALAYGLQAIRPDSLATSDEAACYRMLAEIYAKLGQPDQACTYIQKMYDLMNRYATDHYQSGLSQMEVIYETEKKEAQIAAFDKERSFYFWLLAAAIGLIALLAALLVYRHLAHRRQKALLAAKVALETEAKERHILARDLHDSLGGMLSLLRLKISTQEGGEDDYLALLDNTIVELRRVSHHLMPEELLRGGLVSALHDFAVSVPGAQFQTFGHITLDKEQELVLYRCAYELVNNALKHAQADHIDIQLMQDARETTLTVGDNGKGMDNIPTDGIGLQNIRERIAPYHGKLRIVANKHEGTEINVSLPL